MQLVRLANWYFFVDFVSRVFLLKMRFKVNHTNSTRSGFQLYSGVDFRALRVSVRRLAQVPPTRFIEPSVAPSRRVSNVRRYRLPSARLKFSGYIRDQSQAPMNNVRENIQRGVPVQGSPPTTIDSPAGIADRTRVASRLFTRKPATLSGKGKERCRRELEQLCQYRGDVEPEHLLQRLRVTSIITAEQTTAGTTSSPRGANPQQPYCKHTRLNRAARYGRISVGDRWPTGDCPSTCHARA